MRDLKRAMKDGPKAVFTSLADLPQRHPFAIAGFVGGLALVLLIFAPGGILDQKDEISVQKNEITKIGSLCGPAALKPGTQAAKMCAARTRIALLNCRSEPQCKSIIAVLQKGLKPTTKGPIGAGGVVIGGGHNPSGQHGGHAPPSHGGHGNGGGGKQPAAPAPAPTPAPEEPGKSGEAPGHTGENPGQSGAEPPGQSGESPGKGSVVGGVEGVVEGVGKVACSALERIEGICPK